MIQVIKFKGTDEEKRQQWLITRSNGIGASEVASAMGINQYCSQYEWWKLKTEARQGNIIEFHNKATERGHYLEGVVAQMFEDSTGHHIIKASEGDWLSHNDECPFAYASPDRTFWINENGLKSGKNAEANKGLLECKTTQIKLNEEGDGEDYIPMDGWRCPLSYYLQVQWQMYCTGKRYGAIAILDVVRWDLYVGYISYNEEMVNTKILPSLRDAWSMVVNGIEPPLTTAEDIKAKYPTHEEGKKIACSSEVFEIIRELKGVNEQITSLKKEKEKLENSVRVAFEDAEAIVDTEGKTLATYKGNISHKFDTKRFQQEHGDLYEEFCDESTSRTLRIK